MAGLARLSLENVARLGRALADVGWALGIRRRVCLRNLDLVYGDRLDPAEKRRIGRSAHRNFVISVLEMLRASHPSAVDEMAARIDLRPKALLEDLAKDPRGVVFAVAHSGNFDLAGLGWVRQTRSRLCVVMKPLESRRMNDALVAGRGRYGFDVTGRWDRGMLRDLIRRVDAGERVCILPDQHARRFGVTGTFLGRRASTHRGPAFVALKARDPRIVVGVDTRIDDGPQHVVWLEEIDDFTPTGRSRQDVAALTQRINDVMGEIVRRHPESYLWQHRRWRDVDARGERETDD